MLNVCKYSIAVTRNLTITNISKIAQIVGVASDHEGEAKLGTEGMVPCTMIHSNFSMRALFVN